MKKAFQVALAVAAMALSVPGLHAQAASQQTEDALALQKIIQTQVTKPSDLDERMAAIDSFVGKYPNSLYKPFAFTVAGQAAQMKQDSTKAIFYYNQAIKADPKDYMSMLMIASETANSTGQDDLKKEDKLKAAEKLVAEAKSLIPGAPKPNPQITDQQWAAELKDNMGQAYEATGLIALARKKYDDAAAAFKQSLDTSATKQPATYVRLGAAYNEAKKFDEADKVLDQVIALPNLDTRIKQVAQNEKTRTQQLRNAK